MSRGFFGAACAAPGVVPKARRFAFGGRYAGKTPWRPGRVQAPTVRHGRGRRTGDRGRWCLRCWAAVIPWQLWKRQHWPGQWPWTRHDGRRTCGGMKGEGGTQARPAPLRVSYPRPQAGNRGALFLLAEIKRFLFLVLAGRTAGVTVWDLLGRAGRASTGFFRLEAGISGVKGPGACFFRGKNQAGERAWGYGNTPLSWKGLEGP